MVSNMFSRASCEESAPDVVYMQVAWQACCLRGVAWHGVAIIVTISQVVPGHNPPRGDIEFKTNCYADVCVVLRAHYKYTVDMYSVGCSCIAPKRAVAPYDVAIGLYI